MRADVIVRPLSSNLDYTVSIKDAYSACNDFAGNNFGLPQSATAVWGMVEWKSAPLKEDFKR